ncbi:ankyrin repeat domain-containing protein 16 isoform X2 [Orussus abietinus]|uniref:ankyrin repeat domain-containing protein 16 isoform X2 n=1 Tax=Orussus abietinus TaxID=222816 RepID=UPI000625F51A|nr:ankyrin repeat domain-containing protein 16 isoform X2 [Orussus abietinus]
MSAKPNLSREFLQVVSDDTPLHLAAREGHLHVVKHLCEGWSRPSYRVDVTNNDMKRPLHDAAQFSRSDILKYLIQQGAYVDSLKRGDWTPLMLACTKKNTKARECVDALLKANANPFIRNKDGWTPLSLACRTGDVEVIKLLLDRFPESIDTRSNNGRSVLHIAAFHDCESTISILVAKNVNLLNCRDSSGSTPLHESVKSGSSNAMKLLLKLGADVTSVDVIGQTILHVAALVGNIEAIDYILRNNLIPVNVEAHFNMTPLTVARRSKQEDVVNLLLKFGANR